MWADETKHVFASTNYSDKPFGKYKKVLFFGLFNLDASSGALDLDNKLFRPNFLIFPSFIKERNLYEKDCQMLL